ncbi:MAG: hypothetical protein ACTSV2_06665 [Candidatus Thorarchaeota archaeon]
MAHSELWLEMKGSMKQFRVALLIPEGFEIPEGFSQAEKQRTDTEKIFLVTEWIDGIKKAKDEINRAAKFYNDREIKFLFFRELRKPI